jgi:hypothetical protein
MPQEMSALGRRADTGTAYCANYGPPYHLTRNWDERDGRCDKDIIANLVGSAMPQIVQDRVSDLLWEWQSCLASTFARYDKRSFLPKQIAKFQCADIASA